MSTGSGGGATLVRPAVRRAAIVAFAVLIPIAAHSLWDYVEIRRLVREIEAITQRGEPVTERQAGVAPPLVSGTQSAGAYYLAGSILVLGIQPSSAIRPILEWFAQPSPDRRALDALTVPLDAVVARTAPALRLADTGAGLPFDGFPAGTEFSYRIAAVGSLSDAVTARTLADSLSGDGDAAVDSIVSRLRLRRTLRDGWLLRAWWMAVSGDQVALVLSVTQPSPEALVRLQSALDAEDRPERSLDDLLRQRAQVIEQLWWRYYGSDPGAPRFLALPMRSVTETIMRPWFTHRAVALLRTWAELIEVARLPWPERVRRGAVVLERRPQQGERAITSIPLLNENLAFAAFTQAVDGTGLVIDRASKIAVAIERYQRDRGALPSSLDALVPEYLQTVPQDPYSGQPLLFRPAVGSYTVYSVGPNQRDDGGDLTSELTRVQQQGWGRRVIRGADIGVRVLVFK